MTPPAPPPAPRPARALIVAAFAAVYVLWGSTYYGIAVAIETIPPFPMVALRQLLAGVLLLTIVRLRGVPWPRARDWRGAVVGGVLLLVLGNGLVSWAEQRIASGVASLVVSTTPLWILTFAALVPGGERPGRRAIGGLVLGTIGLLVLAGPDALAALRGEAGAGGSDPLAIAAVVGATIAWAAGTVLGRFVPRHENAFMASAQQMLVAGVLLLLVTAATGDLGAIDWGAVSMRSRLAVAYLVLAGSLLGFSAYIWLLRVVSPSLVATYAYVNPIVALALGSWLGHETIGPRTLVAAAVVLAGVVLVVLPSRASTAPAASAPRPAVR
ncbi:MAG: EamA family transporter [Gemmatimonadaceae bacterium]|nr:EamA family transporter [Gemmatimonadaceae bacterium]